MDNVKCTGSENSFLECEFLDGTKEDCKKHEGAGVHCHANARKERKGYLRSNNYRRVV